MNLEQIIARQEKCAGCGTCLSRSDVSTGEMCVAKYKCECHWVPTSSIKEILEGVKQFEEKSRIAGGNYHCGEEGCCGKAEGLEEESIEFQAGYNTAKSDTINYLEEIIEKL